MTWLSEMRDRAAWDRAMRRCRENIWGGRPASRLAAIRTIRKFECVNRTAFDARNSYHVDLVSGMAVFQEVFDGLRAIRDRSTVS